MVSDNKDPNFMGEDIYRENILDYFKNPRNKGVIENPDIEFDGKNVSCGDQIKIMARLDGDKIIDVKFNGRGCAISQASASMMTEELIGKTIKEAMEMSRDDIVELLGIEIGPVRTKCATLALSTLKEGIKEYDVKKKRLKFDGDKK